MTLFRSLLRKENTLAIHSRTMPIMRHFIETGDERRPLAGIWMPLHWRPPNDSTAVPEDSKSLRPVLGILLLWRAIPQAIHQALTLAPYIHWKPLDRCLRRLAASHLSHSFSAPSA